MSLELGPLDDSALSPAVRKVTATTAPPQLRLMAARGMAPLAPPDLVVALYQFSVGEEQDIVDAARKTARELPEGVLAGALAGALDGRVLDFFGRAVLGRPRLLQVVLLNAATADETFAHVAKTCDDMGTELIARNEQRLLRHPAIITSLYMNPRTRMSTATRAIELAVRGGIELEGIPSFAEVKAAIQSEGVPDPSVDAAFWDLVATNAQAAEAEAGQGAEGPEGAPGEPLSDEELLAAAAAAADEAAEAAAAGQAPSEGATNIARLPVAAKIRLATIGNAFARAVLVRDINRMVAMAAIRSPGITEHEAERYAGNRSLHEEVVRYIAQQRGFTKRYSAKVNLVNNPKCPLQSAMNFLGHLTAKDLRQVARSKGIPAALAKAAQGLISKREAKP